MKENSLEFIHNEKYGVALQVAKKFVAKTYIRPILQYVQHLDNGDMVATDSRRLIRIKNIHGFKEEYLVNPATLDFAKGNYPKTDKLIESADSDAKFTLNAEHLKLWLQMFKSMNQLTKKMRMHNKCIVMESNGSNATFSVHNTDISFNLPVTAMIKGGFKIAFSAEYMKDALEAHTKLESKNLVFRIPSEMKPMLISDEDNTVETLVLPVRIYD